MSPRIDPTELQAGETDFAAEALFEQAFIDRAEFARHLRQSLHTQSQVTLSELLETQPPSHGLAEPMAWTGEHRARQRQRRAGALADGG